MNNDNNQIIEEKMNELREYYVEMHPMHMHDSHNPPLLYNAKTKDVDELFKSIRTALLEVHTSAEQAGYLRGLDKCSDMAKDIEQERWRTAFEAKPKLGMPLHELLLRIAKEKSLTPTDNNKEATSN